MASFGASGEVLYRHAPISIAFLAAGFALLLIWSHISQVSPANVSSLQDPVPYVFNTIQFLTDNDRFMSRVT